MQSPKHIPTEHKDIIHDVSFDYYGRRLATCSSDHTVKVSWFGEDVIVFWSIYIWQGVATPPKMTLYFSISPKIANLLKILIIIDFSEQNLSAQ